MTEYALPQLMGSTAQQRMRKALTIGMEVDWVRAAERAIANALTGCEWHLEDPDDETIDGEYEGDPIAVQAYDLLTNPQGAIPISGPEGIGLRQSRRQQLTLTTRHLGLAGSAAWLLDMVDGNGLPHAILYIRPDRLTPECDKQDVLTGWRLDKSPGNPGRELPIDDMRLMQFEPPDTGVFGIGLIESSVAKGINSGLIDKHYTTMLASGGRISGVMSPAEGIIDDGVYKQLVADWRNIVEQPDAARRLQIVRAPIQFTSTVQSVEQMAIIELMQQNRDALLALWGVPLTMLNGQNAGSTGLNGGEARKYDEAVLWQGAVDTRAKEIAECIQSILDLWEPVIGWAPRFEWDPPAFDDDAPMYEMASKALNLPLRNSERRAIVGLDPFGDPALDNTVLMPINIAVWSMAPDEDGTVPSLDDIPQEEAPEPPQLPPGTLPPGGGANPPGVMPPALAAQAAKVANAAQAVKASLGPKGVKVLDTGARKLRDRMDAKLTPKVKDAVAEALKAQGDAIASAVEQHWEHIVRKGGKDESAWWRDGKLSEALRPAISTMAEQTAQHIADAFGGG